MREKPEICFSFHFHFSDGITELQSQHKNGPRSVSCLHMTRQKDVGSQVTVLAVKIFSFQLTKFLGKFKTWNFLQFAVLFLLATHFTRLHKKNNDESLSNCEKSLFARFFISVLKHLWSLQSRIHLRETTLWGDKKILYCLQSGVAWCLISSTLFFYHNILWCLIRFRIDEMKMNCKSVDGCNDHRMSAFKSKATT